MKFTQWIKIREQMNQPVAPQTAKPQQMGSINKISKPNKNPVNDNIRSILLKSKDTKAASQQIGKMYDNQISSATEPAEMAKLAKEKNSTLSALQGG